MNIDDTLRTIAASNHHLITRQASHDSGRTLRSFDRAIEAGLLVRVDRGIAVLAGTAVTPLRRMHAAVQATPQRCLVSHRSAAFIWGAPVSGVDPVDLLSLDRTGWTKRSDVVVHRPRDLRGAHAVKERGFEVTAPPRTLVDVGAVAPEAVGPTLTAMLIRGVVTVATAERAAVLHGRTGRAGVPALRAAIDALPLGRKAPDSVLEPLAARVFERAGIRGWTFHARACGFERDFAFERERLDVEVDGWRWHRDAFEADRERDAILTAAGWAVMRFTWRQVNRQAAWVTARIKEALAGRSGPR